MKSLLNILKYLLLALLLVAMIFGYLFFGTWQKNARPVVTESRWDKTEILLGHSSTLSLTITAPWHRELDSARPSSFPDFLAPVARLGTIQKGPLGLTGNRTWFLTIPFVATDTQSLEGKTASFPVKTTSRVSPSSVNLELPPLTILSPENLPATPLDPQAFLNEEPPVLSGAAASAQSSKPWWPWALGALLALALLIYILRRTGVIKTTPPWEKALARLDNLPTDGSPAVFFSKLTDILKGYTSERYSIRARAKTSAEFIRTLQELPAIPNEYLTELPVFAKLADGVKFADQIPAEGEAHRALELVRSFVKATIPAETTTPSHD